MRAPTVHQEVAAIANQANTKVTAGTRTATIAIWGGTLLDTDIQAALIAVLASINPDTELQAALVAPLASTQTRPATTTATAAVLGNTSRTQGRAQAAAADPAPLVNFRVQVRQVGVLAATPDNINRLRQVHRALAVSLASTNSTRATVAAETAMLGVDSQAPDSLRQTAASHVVLGCIKAARHLILASTAAQESISKVQARHLAAPAGLASTNSTPALVAAEAVLLVATSHTRSRAQVVVASPAVLATIKLPLVRIRAVAVRLGNIRDPRLRLAVLPAPLGVIRIPAARAVARNAALAAGSRIRGKTPLAAAFCAALDNFKVLSGNLRVRVVDLDSTKGLPDKHRANLA